MPQENRYELLERIGAGGMAEVYRARMVGPAGFQKVVALKRILEDLCTDQDFIHRFGDEARLTARLQHPNICQVLDFGTLEGRYYLTLEYVHGLDLAHLLKRLEAKGELLAPDLTLMVISGVLRGLSYAHRATDESGQRLGIVHRDVSPQNVLLSINGDIKLSDFGAAKANAAVRQARTQENIALGKLAYMAPEQRIGRPVDARTDVFTAGVLLAEMLQGPDAFRRSAGLRGADQEMLANTARGRFPDPVAARVSSTIARAVERDPDRRFTDALSMLSELDSCFAELGLSASQDRLGALVSKLMDVEEKQTHRRDRKPEQQPPQGAPSPFSTASLGPSDLLPTADANPFDDIDEYEPLSEIEEIGNIEELDEGDLLQEMGLATAPTELAHEMSAGGGVEDLETRLVRGSSATPVAQNGHPEKVLQNEAPIDELKTNIVAANRAGEEQLETQIHRGSANLPVSMISSNSTPASPSEPGPRGPALQPAPSSIGPSPTHARQPNDVGRQGSPDIGASPEPSAPPEPAAHPPWAIPEQRVEQHDDKQQPSASTVKQDDASLPANPASDQPWTSRVVIEKQPEQPAKGNRTKSNHRRKLHLVLALLTVVTIAAIWGSCVALRWQEERNRAPFPLDESSLLHTSPDASAASLVGSEPSEEDQQATGGAIDDSADAGSDRPSTTDVPPPPASVEIPRPQKTPPRHRRRPPEEHPTTAPRQQTTEPTSQPQKVRPTPVRRGTKAHITVLANPPGRVYVDGRLVGHRTPARAVEVSPGSHRVRVVHSSTSESTTRSITIRAGEHQILRLNLNDR